MAVTFLTNEDKAVLDGQITALSEEIAAIKEANYVTSNGVVVRVNAATDASISVEGETTEEVTLIHHGKNFLPVYPKAVTSKGVTSTPNEDGTIHLAGTSTGIVYVDIAKRSSPFYLPPGKYMLSTSLPNSDINFQVGSGDAELTTSGIGACTSTTPNRSFEVITGGNFYASFNLSAGITYDADVWAQIERVESVEEWTDFEKPVRYETVTMLPTTVNAYEGKNILYTSTGDVLKILAPKSEATTDEFVENFPAFTFPAKSVAVVGHEWNMYIHNVVNYMSDEYFIRYQVSPSITGAKQLDDVLRFTPSEDDVGIHELTLKLYRKTEESWVLVKTHTISINVIADTSLAGKNVLFIGDSLTQAGVYPAEIQHNLSNGGMTSLGTRSATVEIGGTSLTVNHEGRAGWTAYDYTRTRDGYLTNVTNPFYNEDAGAFDFAYYMSAQGYSGVDVVCIGLGTNGVDKKGDICTALDVMIKSIHAYNPDIKVLVSLITLPATQDGCGNNNGLQNSELLKMQTLALNRLYLEKYQNTMANVDVAELYFALDTKHDYATDEQPASARNPQTVVRQTNNVHPNVYGYLKFADVWYNNILYHLTSDN